MNIFILDSDPAIAASYHCDQHLSKMILEAAQMLSTAAAKFFSSDPGFYKPAYTKHPCTIWCCESLAHCNYVVGLARELEEIRLTKGMNPHSSIDIVDRFHSWAKHFEEYNLETTEWALAMPAFIKLRTSLSAVQKYQEYYQYKHSQWIKTKGPAAGMSFTGPGRKIPPFLQNLEGIRT